MRVSVSDLLKFDECPRLWWAVRRENLDDSSRPARVGLACHMACERITAWAILHPGRPAHEAARTGILEYAAATNLPDPELHEALDVMDFALAPGSGVQLTPGPGWQIAAEYEINLDAEMRPIEGAEKAAYGGRLDRLQFHEALRLLEVVDWKTGEDWMSSEDLAQDEQAQWYAYLAFQLFPDVQVVTFRRAMLRLGYTAIHEFHRTDACLTRIVLRMRALRAALTKARDLGGVGLEERHGKVCGGCPRRHVCRGRMHALDRGSALGDAPDRTELARRRYALQAAADELKEWLKEDVRLHGPIPMPGDKVLDHHPEKRMALRGTVAETVQRLRELGLNDGMEREIFAPSERSMPGLVKKAISVIVPNRGAQDAYVKDLLCEAHGFTFEVRKARV